MEIMSMKGAEQRLKIRNIKPTAMRELVLKVMTEQKSAVSLSDLEQKLGKVDKSTLYRTLKTFEENKLIHSIDDGTGAIKYALCTESCQCHLDDLHVHFHCTQCRQTYCLNNFSVPSIDLPVNFKIETINLVIKGTCSNCDK